MTEEWTLPLELRGFRLEDYERLAQVYGSIFPDYDRSSSEWRHWDESLDTSKYYFKRYVCVNNEDGEVVGFGQSQHIPDMFHPQKLWVDIWVDSRHQGRGVASAIYQHLEKDLGNLSAITAWVMAKEDMPMLRRLCRPL